MEEKLPNLGVRPHQRSPDGEWSVFSFINKNNEEFTAYQIDTSVNGVNGMFESIMDSAGTITHQQFAPNVFTDGVPQSHPDLRLGI